MASDPIYSPLSLKLAEKWREQFNPLEWLTLRRIVGWLYLQQLGNVADITWLYEFIERRNPVLMACVLRRTSAMEKLDWSIKAIPEDELPAGATQAQAEAQRKVLLAAYQKIDNLRDAVNALALATFRGFAHLEKHYDTTGAVTHLEPVPQWNWARAGRTGEWFYNQGAQSVYAIAGGGNPNLEAIDTGDFIIREVNYPVDEVAVVPFFDINMARKDWTGYLATFGIPPIFIELPADAPADQVAAYQAQAEQIISDSRGTVPSGSKIHTITPGAGANPFLEYLRDQREMIVLAATGGKLTMLAEKGTGTLAGGAHKDTFDEIAEAEAVKISEEFQRQFDKPILDEAFPGQPVLARFMLEGKELSDTSAIVADIASLAGSGLQVDTEQVEEKTAYRVSLRDPVNKTAVRAEQGDPTVKQPPTQNRAALLNRRDPAEAALVKAAMKDLAPAQAKSLKALVTDFQKQALEADDAELGEKTLAFLNRLPAYLKKMNVKPATAQVIQNTITAGYLNGLTAPQPERKN